MRNTSYEKPIGLTVKQNRALRAHQRIKDQQIEARRESEKFTWFEKIFLFFGCYIVCSVVVLIAFLLLFSLSSFTQLGSYSLHSDLTFIASKYLLFLIIAFLVTLLVFSLSVEFKQAHRRSENDITSLFYKW